MADASSSIPDKPALEGLEAKWGEAWEREGTHRFDRTAALADGPDAVFSIDTPPPTASGSLHIGHVFSYTHMDLAARFQRMRGKHLFYPMGWDDNGLPTERRVQNYYGVRCDPTLPYDPGVHAAARGRRQREQQGRRSGADLAPQLHRALREADRRRRGAVRGRSSARSGSASTGRSPTARSAHEAQLAAQRAFLRNLERGEAYQADAPTLWDVDLPHRRRPGRARRQATSPPPTTG